MSLEFLITSFIIVASPGTGALYTLAAGLSRGSRASVVAAFGCTLGCVPHLAAAILGYAQNIDRLENLTAAVNRMVERHVDTGVKAEHYPYVAEALLPAIRDVLGADVATDPVLAAWGEAYWFLADLLIAAEAARYAKLGGEEQQAGELV